jgi:protein-tyrosine phosphatase
MLLFMKDRLIFSLKVVKKLIQNWGLNRISVDCNNRVIKSIMAKPWMRVDTVDFSKPLHSWNTPEKWDSVFTAYVFAHPMRSGVSELRYGFPDSNLDEKTVKELLSISEWLYSEWKQGKRCLSRCQAGLNRSSIVTALVLMRDGWSAEDAIELIREKRPGALFNQSFVKFLHAQERLTKAS